MSNTFCVLPWLHLATHPHGGVTTCCISDHTKGLNRSRNYSNGPDKFLNLNDNSIEEIINSDYFNEVRSEMLEGIEPKACWRCYDEERNGTKSKRQSENENFSHLGIKEAAAITNINGSITPRLEFVELRLGNICNAKCRTCNPASSSKWVKEYSELEGRFDFIQSYKNLSGFNWPDLPNFWFNLEKNSDKIKLIYINGGEPTLVKAHWTFLERLAANKKSKDIILWYNLNMSNIPNHAYPLWKKFKEVRISCSIDDTGMRNTYLRSGINWRDVENNIAKMLFFKDREPQIFKIDITQTISWLNIFYIKEFHEYTKTLNLHHHLNWVYQPEYLAAWILPEEIKKKILLKCKQTFNAHDYSNIEMHLNKSSNSRLLEQGIKYNEFLDISRREKMRNTFSELFSELENNK